MPKFKLTSPMRTLETLHLETQADADGSWTAQFPSWTKGLSMDGGELNQTGDLILFRQMILP